MKRVIICMTYLLFISHAYAQRTEPIIIDHNCTTLSEIPTEWIETAKENLYIGYGHTSHGSQLTAGMNALQSHFGSGLYGWSHSGDGGRLHLYEGGSYGNGYLELDCGYAGWDDKTRTYLDANPDCNTLMWSWCGQVNSVDINEHYLNRMAQLETEYPNVDFVYMTGHLEGLGPEGSVYVANQAIRDFCNENNKILFDFADIEKYDPDAEINYQELFADDGCNYRKPEGGTGNWANEWMTANPSAELTQIAQKNGGCAHSVSLNCARKGIACWYMWARIAGWQSEVAPTVETNFYVDGINVYPNPTSDGNVIVDITIFNSCNSIQVVSMQGIELLKIDKNAINNQSVSLDLSELNNGIYYIVIESENRKFIEKVSVIK